MSVKKRIEEWEQEFQIRILDADGFDQRDPHLYERLFTKDEFEAAIAICTISRRNKGVDSSTSKSANQRLNSALLEASKSNKRMKNHKLNIHQRIHINKLYIAFTLPALTTYILWHTYKLLRKKIVIQWYWTFSLAFITFAIILMEPVTPLIAGPFYLWYIIFGGLETLGGHLYWMVENVLFHKGPPAMLNVPFLSTVSVFGNPVSLYFSISKALTSSVVIAIFIVCIRDLTNRFRNRKSAP